MYLYQVCGQYIRYYPFWRLDLVKQMHMYSILEIIKTWPSKPIPLGIRDKKVNSVKRKDFIL